MPGRWSRVGVALCLYLGLVSGRSAAQAPPPIPPEQGTEGVSIEEERDLARIDALIGSHAIEARNQRLVASSILIATGLAAVPLGIVAETSWQQEDFGIGLWVTGALLIGFGSMNLLLESPLERLDAAFQATAGLPTAQRLVFAERSLAAVAAQERTGRTINGVLSFALAAGFVAIGIANLVAAPNNVGSNRTDLEQSGATALVVGGLFTGLGVVTVLLPTPAETAYAVYESGRRPGPPGFRMAAGAAAVRGGAMLRLSGVF